jgi:membrane fusion protein (multidrug efflux system)
MTSPPRLHRAGPCLALAALAVLASCKKDAAPAGPPPPPAVLTITAASRPVPISRTWTGVLDGSQNVDVRPRVSGYLMKRLYEEGRAVKKGDPLFEIDPRPFEAELRQAKANVLMAVAQRTKAEQDVARYQPLVEKNAISKEQYEHALQSRDAAVANVAAAEAMVEQAELNLGFTRITSEIDGIAGIANRGIGDLVGASDSKPLTVVSTVDPIQVSFQISEQGYLDAMNQLEKAGLPLSSLPEFPVGLILADGSRHPEPGKVVKLSREADLQTGTFAVVAQFPNPNNRLRPGQFARVDAVISEQEAVVVPQRAVAEVQGSFQVAVVTEGKAEIRPVKTGERVGSEWIISSGLKAGETVIVEGIQKVRNGTPVAATPWTPPAAQPQPEGGK